MAWMMRQKICGFRRRRRTRRMFIRGTQARIYINGVELTSNTPFTLDVDWQPTVEQCQRYRWSEQTFTGRLTWIDSFALAQPDGDPAQN